MPTTDIRFLMALACAHKQWKGADTAIVYAQAADGRWFVDGISEASAARAYDTAASLVLQNLSVGQCAGKRLFCTYKPTEADFGMAWSRAIPRVYYLDGAALRYATVDDASANGGYPAQVDAGRALTVADDGAAAPEAIGAWNDLRWTAGWWNALVDCRRVQRVHSVYMSYRNAVGDAAKHFVARPATPALLSSGLPGAAAGAIDSALRDKLFMAIAQTLVAKTLNVSEDDDASDGGRQAGHNIGALIVTNDNRIIGWGVNMVRAHGTFHAETAMVLSYLSRADRNTLPAHCTIYTTVRPCHMCAGLIRSVADNTRVIYGQPDARITHNALSRAGIETLSAIAYPVWRTPEGQPATVTAILETLRTRAHMGSVVAFLYTAAARTFFGEIAGRPAILLNYLRIIAAPTPDVIAAERIPEHILRAVGLDAPRINSRTLVRVGGAPVLPAGMRASAAAERPMAASASSSPPAAATPRAAATPSRAAATPPSRGSAPPPRAAGPPPMPPDPVPTLRRIDALDLATYHPAVIRRAEARPGAGAAAFRPQIGPLIEILRAGHTLLTELQRAGLAAP